MIVAERRQYYDVPVKKQPSKMENRHIKKTKKRKKARALLWVCLALSIAMLIISRFAVISEYTHSIRSLETELEELAKANGRLELQIAQAQDINSIEQYAQSQLGMYYPESRDIVYVAVERNVGDSLVAETENEETEGGYSARGWLAVLVGRISNIFNIE